MKNVSAKKARLKYFYFIDTDKLTAELKEHTAYKDFADIINELNHRKKHPSVDTEELNDKFEVALENFLFLIFEHILKAAKRYTEFIVTNDIAITHSIFSEDPYNEEAKSAFYLSGIAIFNHCIIKSFLQTLHEEPACALPNSSFSKASNHIEISNKHTDDIRAGYLASEFYCSDSKVAENSSQNFTNRYGRFKTNTNRLSYKILRSLDITADSDNFDSQKYLRVENQYSNPALFLFWESAVRSFDEALLNDSCTEFNLLKKFAQLDGTRGNWKKTLKTNEDCILFDYILEKAYDFSFNGYIYQLYINEAGKTGTANFPLKELLGTELKEIIKNNAISLPITYNKSIFLKYAITALLNRDSSNSSFPAKSNNLGDFVPVINSSDRALLIHDSNELLRTFFRTLQYIVFPLIEDLWDVVTSEEMLGFKITRKYYQEFIKKNYQEITFDYTKIDFLKLQDVEHQTNYQKAFQSLRKIKKKINMPNEPYNDVLNKTYSYFKDHKNSLADMCAYLDREDLIFKKNTPEDFINQLLLPTPHASTKAPLSKEICTFHDSRFSNLIEFTKMFSTEKVSHKKIF